MRMQLELLKPELAFERMNIHSTIVVFGSTRVVEAGGGPRAARSGPGRVWPQRPTIRAPAGGRPGGADRRQGPLLRGSPQVCRPGLFPTQQDGTREYVIVTGGGPGIMEAANRGAADVQAKSVGLNIHLPHEQSPNPYITPELCFQFRYFAMRKLHFLLRAKALVVFPGGFGTLDELFDALTLRQTGRMQEIPVVMFGRELLDQGARFPLPGRRGGHRRRRPRPDPVRRDGRRSLAADRRVPREGRRA